jgi:hypothetical protein
MLKHCRGGVREDGLLSLHLGELVVCVRGRKLSGVAQGRDHCAASNIKVVWMTIELDGGHEGTIIVQAGVQVLLSVRTHERVETTAFLDGSARSQI